MDGRMDKCTRMNLGSTFAEVKKEKYIPVPLIKLFWKQIFSYAKASSTTIQYMGSSFIRNTYKQNSLSFESPFVSFTPE